MGGLGQSCSFRAKGVVGQRPFYALTKAANSVGKKQTITQSNIFMAIHYILQQHLFGECLAFYAVTLESTHISPSQEILSLLVDQM